MKDWQKGIELDELLKLEETWEGYNERCFSPFGEMKKHNHILSTRLEKNGLMVSY